MPIALDFFTHVLALLDPKHLSSAHAIVWLFRMGLAEADEREAPAVNYASGRWSTQLAKALMTIAKDLGRCAACGSQVHMRTFCFGCAQFAAPQVTSATIRQVFSLDWEQKAHLRGSHEQLMQLSTRWIATRAQNSHLRWTVVRDVVQEQFGKQPRMIGVPKATKAKFELVGQSLRQGKRFGAELMALAGNMRVSYMDAAQMERLAAVEEFLPPDYPRLTIAHVLTVNVMEWIRGTDETTSLNKVLAVLRYQRFLSERVHIARYFQDFLQLNSYEYTRFYTCLNFAVLDYDETLPAAFRSI